MYSILTANNKQKLTAAGIKKRVAERKLSHSKYKETLAGPSLVQSVNMPFEDVYVHQKSFRSYNHDIYTIDTYKVGLTRYDDKRWVCRNGIATRPHGHFRNNI